MKQNLWKTAYKQNHLVFKLGFSILLVGFGFRLLFSQSSNVIPDDNNIIDKDVKLVPSGFTDAVKELNKFHSSGNFF